MSNTVKEASLVNKQSLDKFDILNILVPEDLPGMFGHARELADIIEARERRAFEVGVSIGYASGTDRIEKAYLAFRDLQGR